MKAGSSSITSCRRAVRWRRPTASSAMWSRCCARFRRWKAPRGVPGLQLGLAAVTEANTGDILVKLRPKRHRGIDEIMSEVRARHQETRAGPRRRIHPGSAGHDWRSDGAPQPIQIKLFSQDRKLLEQWAPKVADAIGKIDGVVDILNGVDNTISGPAVTFQVDPSAQREPDSPLKRWRWTPPPFWRANLHPRPWWSTSRAYTLRVRFPAANRAIA